MSYRRQRSDTYGGRKTSFHARHSRPLKNRAAPRNEKLRMRLLQLNPKIEAYNGKSISVSFDGEILRNSIKIVPHEVWVGSWTKSPNLLIDDDIPEKPKKWRQSVALHEILEKYLDGRYGLSGTIEGHFIAEELERKWFLQHHSEKEYDEYQRIVEVTHRVELGFLEKKKG